VWTKVTKVQEIIKIYKEFYVQIKIYYHLGFFPYLKKSFFSHNTFVTVCIMKV